MTATLSSATIVSSSSHPAELFQTVNGLLKLNWYEKIGTCCANLVNTLRVKPFRFMVKLQLLFIVSLAKDSKVPSSLVLRSQFWLLQPKNMDNYIGEISANHFYTTPQSTLAFKSR